MTSRIWLKHLASFLEYYRIAPYKPELEDKIWACSLDPRLLESFYKFLSSAVMDSLQDAGENFNTADHCVHSDLPLWWSVSIWALLKIQSNFCKYNVSTTQFVV